MEEAGILENPALLRLVLPSFEPGRLFELRWEATRLRERPVVLCLMLVLAANIVVFWSMASAAAEGTLALDRVVTFASAALTTSTIAFGGLSWALDGSRVVEVGTHDDLVARGGQYAELYGIQAAAYR